MKDEQLDDLKQFIDSRISQSEVRIKKEITIELSGKIESEVQSLRQEMQDGFAGVGEAIDQILAVTDNHEARLTKLEEQSA